MTSRVQHGWVIYSAVFPSFVIALTQVVRNRAEMAQVWPIWRPMLLDFMLLLAGATLVAAAAAGVHAWRRHA